MEVLKGKRDVKIAKIALHAYAKQNNIPAAELEFVELKGSSFFHEGRKEYRHYNFLVKCSDGTTTLFFAETCPCCKEDSGIYLCCPLEENDNGSIYTNISRFFVNALVAKSVAWNLGIPLLLTISVAIGISVLYSQI
uniref:DUF3615 domain-containing protein n=1 Tax=Oryza barthii TaxID=65489 RepID=A0A0D3HGD0_9ORYZ